MQRAAVSVAGILLLPLMFLLLSLGASEAAASSSNLGAYIRPVGGIQPGDPVPDFHAKGLFGEDLDLSKLLEYEKKVVLTIFTGVHTKNFLLTIQPELKVELRKLVCFAGLLVNQCNFVMEVPNADAVIC